MITRKALSRRTLLKGMGVAIGLPFLDAMVPAFAFGRPRSRRFGSCSSIYPMVSTCPTGRPSA